VTVIDTAGIRDTDDPVEQEGVRRARVRAGEADLVLWLADAAGAPVEYHGTAPVWLVRNKIDLVRPHTAAVDAHGRPMAEFRISARHGVGLPELIEALVGFAQNYFGGSDGGLIARERQRMLVKDSADSLRRAIAVAGEGEELAAEELRAAAYSLGRLLGRVDVEDILDVIFREFCVGK